MKKRGYGMQGKNFSSIFELKSYIVLNCTVLYDSKEEKKRLTHKLAVRIDYQKGEENGHSWTARKRDKKQLKGPKIHETKKKE